MGSRRKLVNYFNLFWRYGWDLMTVDGFVNEMLTNFSKIYTLQKEGQTFDTVPQMLQAMGTEEMYGYTQETLRQALEKLGVKPLLINELVTGVMRINYGQDVTLNAFAGETTGKWNRFDNPTSRVPVPQRKLEHQIYSEDKYVCVCGGGRLGGGGGG